MKNIRPYQHHHPQIAPHSYIDPCALVIGQATLAEHVSVWPFAVIRADVNQITIGAGSNIQDHAMLHVSHKNSAKPTGSPLQIGEDVTIGHHAVLHGCTLGNRILIGIQSIILDDAIIPDEVMIGAGSLVPPNKILESGYLYLGSPVKKIRPLSQEEKTFLSYSASHYIKVKNHYLNENN